MQALYEQASQVLAINTTTNPPNLQTKNNGTDEADKKNRGVSKDEIHTSRMKKNKVVASTEGMIQQVALEQWKCVMCDKLLTSEQVC